MNTKRIIGIIIIIIGVVSLITSRYIKHRVEEGKGEISSAEKKVGQADSLFSLHPFAEEVGKKGFTDSARKKIEQGKRDVKEYSELAYWLQIGGIVLIVAGVGVVFISGKKKGRRS